MLLLIAGKTSQKGRNIVANEPVGLNDMLRELYRVGGYCLGPNTIKLFLNLGPNRSLHRHDGILDGHDDIAASMSTEYATLHATRQVTYIPAACKAIWSESVTLDS